MAMHRSNVYGFLAAAFREEPTPLFLKHLRDSQFLSILSDAGANIDKEFLNGPEEKLLEDLAVEYTRLFLGPGKHISPHESVHHKRDDGDWGQLWGKSTVEVKKFIESTGLEYKSEFTGMPDHIGVEFEFMQQVTKREAQAWEEKNREDALNCLKMEKKFVDEHIGKWVPGFCDNILSEAELPFYREISKLTKSFMEFEQNEIPGYLSAAQKKEA